MSNNQNAPFYNANANWSIKKIGDIIEETTKRNTTKSINFVLSVSRNFGIISQQERFGDRVVAGSDLSNYKILYKNEFAYNPLWIHTGSIGMLSDNECGVVSPIYETFKVSKNTVMPEFLSFYFKSKYFIISASRKLEISVRSALKNYSFKEIELKIPNIETQKKVVLFLSFIENNIKGQKKLVDKLKNSFNFFIDNSSKIFSIKLTKPYTMNDLIQLTSQRNKNNKINLVLSVSRNFGIISQKERFGDRVVAGSDLTNYKIIHKNEFAFNPLWIHTGSIGMLFKNEVGIISPIYTSFKVSSKMILPEFLNYYLKSKIFIADVNKRMEISVRTSIKQNDFKEIIIFVPSISDQLKIIKFLKLYEKFIEIQHKILDLLIQRRRYLLEKFYSN